MSQLARSVLHQRHRPRAIGGVLHGPRAREHQPHRDPAGARGHRRAPGRRLEAAARPAEGAGRALRPRHRASGSSTSTPATSPPPTTPPSPPAPQVAVRAAAARAVAGHDRLRASTPTATWWSWSSATRGPTTLPTGAPWLGQYCLNVTDIDATAGLLRGARARRAPAAPRSPTPPRRSSSSPARAASCSWRSRRTRTGRSGWARCGSSTCNTDDCEALHQAAVDAGHPSILAPMFLDRWNTTIAFVGDPDGYQVELVQRHPD